MSFDGFRLDGRVAVVTGASRGIGRAIALTLAGMGAKVVVSSRKIDACEPVVETIKASGGTAIALPCNVGDPAQLEQLIVQTEQKLGAPRILVCNAASNPVYGPMANIDDKVFEKIMNVNVRSNITLINRVAPGMAAAGGGAVVLLSSVVGFAGSKNIGCYAVSKAADAQLARNYAIELGPKKVRVNAVAPGLIKTDFAEALWSGPGGDAFAKKTPLGRLGEPEDIAGVVAFLASDAARFVTGQTIIADGGVMIADPF
ncbi:MAG: SDR family oxidoreductase [Rhodospirillaceae bacterium]|nr:SDR family oxidoreductase [Rhodospirillaceae bacterium]